MNVTEITPSRGWVGLRLKELWAYRELLFFLTWRDVKVRYKQTLFGASWAIIQPLAMMVVFSIFFDGIVGVPSDGTAYPIFTFTALVPWTLFTQSLGFSSGSIVAGSNLVSKVYFPRLIMPMAATGSFIVDFLIAFSVLIGMMIFYGFALTTRMFWIPAFVGLTMLTALGLGIGLGALNAKFRDIRYVVPFLIQMWFFATPVVYSSSGISRKWEGLYGLNPMVGVIEGFRYSILGTGDPPGVRTLFSALGAVLLFVGSMFYFRRLERTFADVI